MTFNTPTTKNQMYSILQEIFHYYRIERESSPDLTLNALSLTRMSYTPMTESERTAKAQTAVKAAQEEKLLKYKTDLSNQIAEYSSRIGTCASQRTEAENAARANYAAAKANLQNEATKRGIAQSSAVINRLADLDVALASELTAIASDYNGQISLYSAKRSILQTSLNGADNYFTNVFNYEMLAEKDRIKQDEEKLQREIFKYNNGLDEKEQRAANANLTTTRGLQLRYMNVSASEFTKDQLVEMGYYTDAINCVCAYFNTLSALTAYQQIVTDTKVAIYLDDYYANVVYMYKSLANA
ncbi:MAG: hypothetical protein J5911_04845 [Clostridia bacterium]|nr:hypothetical protein [Clostridia bacterium]